MAHEIPNMHVYRCTHMATQAQTHMSDVLLYLKPPGHNPAAGVEALFVCVFVLLFGHRHVTHVILFTLHLSTLHPSCASFH